jgi:hypothetical protein
MDTLIDQIRAALTEGATDDSKQAGANACRTILTALDAKAGEPLAAAPPAASAQPVLAAIGKMDLNQLLDLVIARLRAVNGASTSDDKARSTLARPVSFPIVRVPSR